MTLLECISFQGLYATGGIFFALIIALLALGLHAWFSYSLWPYKFGSKKQEEKGHVARLLTPGLLAIAPFFLLPFMFYMQTKGIDVSQCEKVWSGWFVSIWFFGAGIFLLTLMFYFAGGFLFRKLTTQS